MFEKETSIQKPHAERMAMLEQLICYGWTEILKVESSKSTYYLFESLDKSMTVGLNTGKDDLFNDVIIVEF